MKILEIKFILISKKSETQKNPSYKNSYKILTSAEP